MLIHRAAFVWLLAFAGIASAAPGVVPAVKVQVPERTCNVVEFGAKGSSIWYDTEAFQKAIDSCAEQGGGTVRVPAGYYLISPIYLKSNIRLHLDKGAVLQASGEDAHYHPTEATQRWAGVPKLWPNAEKWIALINVADDSNVALSGEGIIDGQGAIWWERWRADARASGRRGSTNRPRLMFIKNAKNVLIEGVTFQNSPSFHIVFYNTENITIDRTQILAPDWAQNTDAIDPMDSRNVRITRNTISVGDDHIAIKSVFPDAKMPDGNSRNFYIADNTFLFGRGLSIGSETASGVIDLLAENNTFKGSMYGIRIKSPRGIGGPVSNMVYRNTKMQDVETPIVLSGYYRGTPAKEDELQKMLAEGEFKGGFVLGNQIYPPDTDPAKPYDLNKTPYFDNVRFENLVSKGNTEQAAYIIGTPEKPFTNIVFSKVSIEAERGVQVRNASVIDHGLTVRTKGGNKPYWTEAGGSVEAARRAARK